MDSPRMTLLFLTALSAISACESKDSVSHDSSGKDSETDSADTGTVEDTGTQPEYMIDIPVCVKTCTTAADCPEAGADAIRDKDNFKCMGGVCKYSGCNDDDECDEAYPSMDYVCHSTGCLPPCTQASDCSLGTPDKDEDNYTCDNGACVYIGCQSNDECSETYGSNYSCQDTMSTGVPSCNLKCNDDSVTACIPTQNNEAYGEDNYTCIYNECYYTGCNDDEECGTGYQCMNI